jgi:hypothetical protein
MDSFSTSFRVAVEQVAIRRYWQQRVEGRVVKGSDKQTKAQAVAENPFPHIDTRLVRWGSKPTKARKPVDIFKSKLWWNHLPSLHVRSRGKRKVGQKEEGVVEEKEEGGDGGGRQQEGGGGRGSRGGRWGDRIICSGGGSWGTGEAGRQRRGGK